MNPELRAEGFAFTPGERPVLKSGTLYASAGEVTVLFGRNGAGKTVLLECMLGRLAADAGALHYFGECFERPKLRRLARRGMFYLPDTGLLPRGFRFGQVADAVEACHGRHPKRAELLVRLGIEGLQGRRTSEISGGERRRCEWALALLARPRCVVADEPLRGVTPRDQDLLCAIMRELADAGAVVIVTGHEVDTLLGLGDRFVWMNAGATEFLGGPPEARAHAMFRKSYLGGPTPE